MQSTFSLLLGWTILEHGVQPPMGSFQAECWRGPALLVWSLWLQLWYLPCSPLSGPWAPPSHAYCSQICLSPLYPTCSSLCLSNRFNGAPPYNSSLIICVKKSLPVHPRNLLKACVLLHCPSSSYQDGYTLPLDVLAMLRDCNVSRQC